MKDDASHWDRMAIVAVKQSRGVASDKERSALRGFLGTLSSRSVFDELVAVHEAIWWCMDFQRQYSRPFADRGMVGVIVAMLNDVRDNLKYQIDGSLRKVYRHV